MNYYPVLIPTLNRYDHFKRCVESLARNTHADKTELVIGLDFPPSEKYREGYERIKEFIPLINGFWKVTVFERDTNYGSIKNAIDLQKYAYSHYDAFIYTEDDNEFSPCFLDYMNNALEKYKDNDRVLGISGYTHIPLYNLTEANVFLRPSGSAWGIGKWRDKYDIGELELEFFEKILCSLRKSMKIFLYQPVLLSQLISMVSKKKKWGDIMNCTFNILNSTYQLHPSISMVRNWGNDGTGEHCGRDDSFSKQEILTCSEFTLDEIPIMIQPEVKSKLFFHACPKGKIRAWAFIFLCLIKYAVYRIKVIF